MNEFNNDFLLVKKMNSGKFSNYQNHLEAKEYNGCEYYLEEMKYIQRTAKVTPKKIGQFVTLWKRNSDNITTPLDAKDNFNYIVIVCFKDKKFGRFLFPKDILIQRNIISNSIAGHDGKRGFRVYPGWDRPTSKQALDTQKWQLNYFSEGLVL
jgi:hypothetical protein